MVARVAPNVRSDGPSGERSERPPVTAGGHSLQTGEASEKVLPPSSYIVSRRWRRSRGDVVGRRRLRWRRRSTAQRLRVIDRLEVCGVQPAGERVAVTVGDGVAHFSGVRSCGAVWTCGVCGPRIRQRRSEEVGIALGEAERQGLGLVFMTLTVSHHQEDSLERVYGLQEAAWRALQQSRAWRDLTAELGVLGHVVFREVTWGVNGWHPHRHVVMVLRRPVGAAQLGSWRRRAWEAWDGQLRKRGLSSSEARGLDVRPVKRRGSVGIGWYVAKIAQEMTRGDLKRARGDRSFTPEQLLDLVVEDGDAVAAEKWTEYARVTAGRRMLTWSRGLRAMLALPEVEQTDEEVAAEEVGGEVVALLDRRAWWALVRRDAALELLEAAEVGGGAAIGGVLVAVGAPGGSWELVEPFR